LKSLAKGICGKNMEKEWTQSGEMGMKRKREQNFFFFDLGFSSCTQNVFIPI
jgi:hypothetical protein